MADACRIGEEVGDVLNEQKALLGQLFVNTFGPPRLNKNAIKLSLKRLLQKKKNLSKLIQFQDKQISEGEAVADEEYGRMNEELKEIQSDINKFKSELTNNDKKNKALRKIHDLIMGRLEKYQHDTLYGASADPHVQFPVIKEYIMGQYTIPFNHLNELSALDLVSIANKIEKTFKKGDKKAAQQNRGELTSAEETVYDPALVMMESDPSTFGFQIINKSKRILDDANAASAPLKGRLTEALEEIDLYVKGLQGLSDEKKAKLKTDLVTRVHKMLDGQERYIKPMPVMQWDPAKGKAKYTFTSKEEEKMYNKILRDQIENDWNEGGKIQEIDIDGAIKYFILIRQPDSEVYHAYEVPTRDKALPGKKTRLLYPLAPRNVKDWVDFFRTEGIATFRDEFGNQVPGMMKEGYYEALENKPKSGLNAKGKEITVRAYSNYELKEDQTAPPDSAITLLSEAREVFKEVKRITDEKVWAQKGLMTEIAQKMADKQGVSLKQFMKSEDLNEIFSEVTGIDSMNINYTIYNGRAINMNQFFNEMDDYSPYKYSATDMLLGAVRARDEINTKIENKSLRLAALKEAAGVERAAEKLELAKEIKELKGQLLIQNENIDITVGLKTKHNLESNKLQSVTRINATKHRGTMMEPMPLYKDGQGGETREEFDEYGKRREVISNGRRTDFKVFTEYIDDTFQALEKNDLKIQLLDGTLAMSKASSAFVVDHVKASMGQLDVKAGFFVLDYSDSHLAKAMTKFSKTFWGSEDFEVTEEMVYNTVKFHSMLISGSLLGYTSALNNWFQRTSAWIEDATGTYSEARAFVKKYPGIARKIADEAGVTDTLNAMADALMGSSDGQYTATSGIRSLTDYAILKYDKQKFITLAQQSKWWRSRVSNMILRKDPGKRIDAKTMKAGFAAIHDGTYGMNKFMQERGLDSLTEKQIRSFTKDLARIMEVEEVNAYVGWKLNGGFLSVSQAASDFLGFQPSELQMRIEIAVQGVLEAEKAGMIPAKWRRVYEDDPAKRLTHKNAITYSRLLVYNTLFGLSPAFLPKMFRGAIGTFVWKFKPYQWHQARNEWRILNNYYNGIKGEPSKQIAKLLLNILTDPLGKGKGLSNVERKMGRFLISRFAVSTITTGLVHVPGLNWVINSVKYRLFNRQLSSAVSRGGESVLWSGTLQLLLTGLALTGMMGDDDEEEAIYQNAARYFLPVFVNVAIDTFTGDDPLKGLQIYSKGAHAASSLVMDSLSD